MASSARCASAPEIHPEASRRLNAARAVWLIPAMPFAPSVGPSVGARRSALNVDCDPVRREEMAVLMTAQIPGATKER
jgi:hypothetical protein